MTCPRNVPSRPGRRYGVSLSLFLLFLFLLFFKSVRELPGSAYAQFGEGGELRPQRHTHTQRTGPDECLENGDQEQFLLRILRRNMSEDRGQVRPKNRPEADFPPVTDCSAIFSLFRRLFL
ncbi:MAG: hypothetical protein DRI57_23615 [Deltaproteobacteria bacterium]|nr:MAG: hypothetical protein DRI57_23615 [Deltaproteobacteria bacterium]